MNGNTDLIGGEAVSKRLRLRFGTLVLKKNDLSCERRKQTHWHQEFRQKF
jgi:hypothetical protein